MPITQNDLNNLEIRVKSEISKDQSDLRHEDRKKASLYYFKVDDLEKKTAVNDNILKTMNENFQELKEMMKEGFKEVYGKIDAYNDKFSTKEDHKANTEKIGYLQKALDNINLKIAGVSGGFAVIIYLIDKYGK